MDDMSRLVGAFSGKRIGRPGYGVHVGDCREVLGEFHRETFDSCVTSPPGWYVRDVGVPGQIGMELTPEDYIDALVVVFREVRRLLKDDGVLFVHMSDGYWAGGSTTSNAQNTKNYEGTCGLESRHTVGQCDRPIKPRRHRFLKQKDLIGAPWRLAFALQREGWYLRQELIVMKANPTPESVRDRCTSGHDHVFLLSKSKDYYFDSDVIREDRVTGSGKRNRRSVWRVASSPHHGYYSSVTPLELARLCVLAGTRDGGVVLDPFAGVSNIGVASISEGRRFAGVEVDPSVARIGEERLSSIVSADVGGAVVGGE